MQKLKNMEITLVKEDNEGVKIDYTKALLRVAKAFGGYSLHESKGAWEDGGKLYEDASNVLSIAVGEYTLQRARAFRKVIETLFNEGGQLAVFVKLGQYSYIVEPNDLPELNEIVRSFMATK